MSTPRKLGANYKYWTQQEILTLRAMTKERKTRSEIARALGRSWDSIRKKQEEQNITKQYYKHEREPHVTLSLRVTEEFFERFKKFCNDRASPYGATAEVVMNAFMNQVEEYESAQRSRPVNKIAAE